MRTIYLNAGRMAHFGSTGSALDEQTCGPGKAIIVKDGLIEAIKSSDEVTSEWGLSTERINGLNKDVSVFDLEGQSIVPGLIDGHTHLIWAGDRSREVSWRREGKTYAEIANMGGGIQHTVRETRDATDDALVKLGYQRLRGALRSGTTHLEAKSGYGLDTASELRLLRLAEQLNGIDHLPTIDPTWMGAHDVPSGATATDYVESLLSEQLPAVVDQGIARSADVFCEPGWFTVEQSEDVLKASRNANLDLRMHVDEFVDGGGGDLAAALGVTTADHAYHTSMETRLRMDSAGVNAGFLPGTPYAMGDEWPDMDAIVEHDLRFTLASDFNPNCRTMSLPFMASLMVQRCGMHPLVALAAITVNAAKTTPHPSGASHGTIVEGGVANFNIVDGPNWEAVTLSPSDTPFSGTVLNGQYIAH